MTPNPATVVDAPSLDTTPPFWVSRVRLRNYKSVAFCDVALDPFTVLVGRNGAGKSNILDALAFVGELAYRDIRDVIADRGGPEALLCRTGGGESVEISTTLPLPSDAAGREQKIEYRFEFSPRRRAWAERVGEVITHLKRDKGVTAWDEVERFTRVREKSPGGPGYSILTIVDDEVIPPQLREGLRGLRRYQIRPETMRPRSIRGAATFLKPDGSNAATVYRYLKESGSWRYGRLRDYLEQVVPQLRAVEPAGNDYEDGLEFSWWTGESGAWPEAPRAGDPRVVKFPASAMSDGTLRAFGLLLAALQTTELEGDPSVILIEEPEAGLHPAALRALAAAFDEAALRVQVILTTHSPELLDAPGVTPGRVRVVDARSGATGVGPVDAASVEIVRDHLNSLGGLERDNQLEPDLDDQDRQADLRGRAEGGA